MKKIIFLIMILFNQTVVFGQYGVNNDCAESGCGDRSQIIQRCWGVVKSFDQGIQIRVKGPIEDCYNAVDSESNRHTFRWHIEISGLKKVKQDSKLYVSGGNNRKSDYFIPKNERNNVSADKMTVDFLTFSNAETIGIELLPIGNTSSNDSATQQTTNNQINSSNQQNDPTFDKNNASFQDYYKRATSAGQQGKYNEAISLWNSAISVAVNDAQRDNARAWLAEAKKAKAANPNSSSNNNVQNQQEEQRINREEINRKNAEVVAQKQLETETIINTGINVIKLLGELKNDNREKKKAKKEQEWQTVNEKIIALFDQNTRNAVDDDDEFMAYVNYIGSNLEQLGLKFRKLDAFFYKQDPAKTTFPKIQKTVYFKYDNISLYISFVFNNYNLNKNDGTNPMERTISFNFQDFQDKKTILQSTFYKNLVANNARYFYQESEDKNSLYVDCFLNNEDNFTQIYKTKKSDIGEALQNQIQTNKNYVNSNKKNDVNELEKLFIIYHRGDDVKADQLKAYEIANILANKHNKYYSLATLFNDYTGEYENINLAKETFEKGVKQGDCRCYFELAVFYLYGSKEVVKDQSKAIALLKLGAERNNYFCCNYLAYGYKMGVYGLKKNSDLQEKYEKQAELIEKNNLECK